MSAEMECTRLYDLAPELALGLLDGAERAEALAHIERCATCHADVAWLTGLGEHLLLLAPEVPPPASFETRVLARVAAEAPAPALPATADVTPGRRPSRSPRAPWSPRFARSRSRSRRARGESGAGPRRRHPPYRSLGAVAAAVALVVAFAGLMVGMSGDDGPTVAASAPMENAEGHAIGAADLLEGSPTVVRLDLAEWVEDIGRWSDPPHGPWTLRVVDDTGQRERYDMPSDDATPEITLDHGDLGSIHQVSVLDGNGKVWCTGTFE